MRRIVIQLAGGVPLYQPAACRAVLERLLQRELLPPETWGLDAKGGKPIDLDAVVRITDGTPSTRLLRFKRKKAPAGEMFVAVGEQPSVAVHVTSRNVARDGSRCVSLADSLAEVFQPDVGWVHACFDLDPPLTDDRTQALWIMDQIVDGGGGLRGYGRSGPGGLAMISYLGPRWAVRLGDHLRAVPGLLCESLAWGGMRVALCDAVFDAPDAHLADQWRLAMARVQAEQVFATCSVRPDGATRFARGARFNWTDTYRP